MIISESQPLTSRIETLLSNKDWLAESMSACVMIGQGSSSLIDYRCVIFVIDNNFRKCFSGLITEMSAFIKNASAHTPIYLLLENDDDAAFSSWLTHVKKTFKSAFEQSSLHDAVQNIFCTEPGMPQEPTSLV